MMIPLQEINPSGNTVFPKDPSSQQEPLTMLIGRESERQSPSSGYVPLFSRMNWISHADIISKIISRLIQKVVSNDKDMTCCDTALTDFDHYNRFSITT